MNTQLLVKEMKDAKRYHLLKDDSDLAMFASIVHHPENLTNDHIQFIGNAYLNFYSKPQGYVARIFKPHGSHAFAKALSIMQTNGSVQDRWNTLVNFYSKFPKTSGDLAMTLLYVFGWAFDKSYTTYDLRPVPLLNVQWEMLPPSALAEQLQNAVNGFYAKQHLNFVKE
ncbi:MAG: hypothetical protein H0W64_10755 [Gammaproteobacteria bacterium]|nr:hypothetical protein [Gammaproteobacteria bacterium]